MAENTIDTPLVRSYLKRMIRAAQPFCRCMQCQVTRFLRKELLKQTGEDYGRST